MPAPGVAFLGALLWAVTMGASALVNLLLDNWVTPQKIRTVAALFAAGGGLAFPVGVFAARIVSLGRSPEVAFAAAFVGIAAATIGLTTLLYALHYRSYYAEWHAPVFTLTWGFQFAFTMAVASYQFVVLGIRLYFPLGFVALFAAGLWFARHRR
jgi:NAD/NADP transhydrogenase beta subunit